jgi:hypothetical protein
MEEIVQCLSDDSTSDRKTSKRLVYVTIVHEETLK